MKRRLNMHMVKGCEGGLNYNDLTSVLTPEGQGIQISGHYST